MTKGYEIWLGKMKLPILPENLKEILQMDNKKYDTFGGGERILPGMEKLRTWTISSYFPANGETAPSEYRKYYTSLVHRENKKDRTMLPIEPVDFDVIRFGEDGTDMIPVSADVLFESIEWEDRKSEPGDIYYTFKLVEYRKFGTKTV